MSLPLLKVEEFSLSTLSSTILQPISFEIKAGEIIALTGKSGSGKTSLAMAILGLLAPGIEVKSGYIEWNHQNNQLRFPGDYKDWIALRGKEIGFIQQDVYGVFDPILKMGKQMTMLVRERSMLSEQEIIPGLKSMMREVGIREVDRLWNSYPHQLSGGQLQRCQISMVAMLRPPLLIADEPTSAIDKINQGELMQVFLELRNKLNMAILCITHDPHVVLNIAGRIVALQEGGLNPPIERVPVAGVQKVILECTALRYNYSYGGLFQKEGARIGPLSFELRTGTCLGIIGESGSGKSTIAQLLVGLIEPDSGHFELAGKAIDFRHRLDIEYLRSKVQMVFQDGRGSLHPHLTIGELLSEVSNFYSTSNTGSQDWKIPDLLSEVELPHAILNRKPGSLSGGECLRVNIARALLLNPLVLICDESTSALDFETRDGILTLLQKLMRRHDMSLIIITHDEEVIRKIAHQIMVVDEGEIAEQGLLEDVLRDPSHPLTKKIFQGHATL